MAVFSLAAEQDIVFGSKTVNVNFAEGSTNDLIRYADLHSQSKQEG